MTDQGSGRQRRGDGTVGGPCARSEGLQPSATASLPAAAADLRPDPTRTTPPSDGR